MTILNLGRIKMVWKGAYSLTVDYVVDDLISYMGHSYIAIQPSKGIAPALGTDNAYWNVIAKGQTVLSSKGDLLWHDGVSVNRLPVGSSGNVLKVGANGALTWAVMDGKPSATAAKLAEHQGNFGGFANNGFVSPDGTAKVWGKLGLGGNGDGATVDQAIPRPLTYLTKNTNAKIKQLVYCGRTGFAVMDDGTVYGWGANYAGQLGLGDATNRVFPTRIEYFVTNNIKVTKIFTATSRQGLNTATESCSIFFLDDQGRLYGCGANGAGQLGLGDTTSRSTPVRVGTYTGITDVSVSMQTAGLCSAFFLLGGEIYAAGVNSHGQLGLGDTVNRSAFTKVSGLTNVVKIVSQNGGATGTWAPFGFTLALRSDKSVWGTGYNAYGQLGVGDTANRSSFVQVSGLTNAVDIGAADGAYGYAWAVTDTGQIATWGYNAQGALGQGDLVNKTSPVLIDQWYGDFVNAGSGVSTPPWNGKIKKVTSVGSYGYQAIIILTTDGLLFSSGNARATTTPDNTVATNYNRFKPWIQQGLPDGVTFIDIQTAGVDADVYSTLLTSDGRVFTTGSNTYATLGFTELTVSGVITSLQQVQV